MNPDCHERPPTVRVAAMILAAGASSRMTGTHKLRRLWGCATVVEHVAQTVKDAGFSDIVLIKGPGNTLPSSTLQHLDLRVVTCDDAASGMLASIKAGWTALTEHSPVSIPDGVMVILADQPLVSTAELWSLIEEFKMFPTSILVPAWDGHRGNPVTIPIHLGAEIMQQPVTDQGAKFLFSRHPEAVRLFAMPSGSVCEDMDIEEDYLRLKEQAENS